MGKSSLLGVAKNHFLTLYDNQSCDNQIKTGDVIFQIGFPLLVGIIVAIGSAVENWAPSAQVVSNAIMGLSIVSALMCSMAALIFQIRLGVRNDESISDSKKCLIDELFYNIVWAIVIGFFVVLVIVLTDSFDLLNVFVVSSVLIGLISALVSHFIIVVCMCLKRLYRSYEILGIGK